MRLFDSTGTVDIRLTTGTIEQPVGRSGWTTFAAVVQRQTLTSVHTMAGVFTTVNIVKTSLFGVIPVCSSKSSILRNELIQITEIRHH